jgi:hypothetical protein
VSDLVAYAGLGGLTRVSRAPSRVNRSNAYRYRKTRPTGPPTNRAGKSIRPLDDHLRRTVNSREGSESVRFRNRTLPSVNGNSRTDGACRNAHWRLFRSGFRLGISRKHRDEFRSNCSISHNSSTIFEIRRRSKIYRRGTEKLGVEKIWGTPFFSAARRVMATRFSRRVEYVDTRNPF